MLLLLVSFRLNTQHQYYLFTEHHEKITFYEKIYSFLFDYSRLRFHRLLEDKI